MDFPDTGAGSPGASFQPASRKPVYIIAIVTAICLLGDSMLYIVLPLYWREVGLTSLWQVGVLLSVNRFVRLPLNPIIGWLYHRMPTRLGLIVAVALGAATTLGYGICHGFVAWLILRCLWGTAWSLLKIGGFLSVISFSNDSNRGQLMGSYNGIYRLGSLGGMLFGGILTPIFGMQSINIVFGLIALVNIPLIFATIPKTNAENNPHEVNPAQNRKTQSGRSTQSVHTVRSGIWTKPVVKIVSIGLALSVLSSVYGSTLTLVIATNFGIDVTLPGLILTSTALAGVLQAARWAWEPFLAVWFGRRSDGPHGRAPLLITALLVSAAGYALIPWKLPVLAWIAVVLLVMAAATAITTLVDTMASDTARSASVSVVSVMTFYAVATDLGAALGPLVSFWLADFSHGLTAAFLGSAISFALLAPAVRQSRASMPRSSVPNSGR
jgi:MFS family permease